jgi:two-component system, chemotaxis family, protein-glutamate methylesterase/glutaminase
LSGVAPMTQRAVSPAQPSSAIARVMVCDDSLVIRSAISRILEADPAIRVVAKVANGKLAVEEIRRAPVDVIVLDIEMPVMDGLTALPLLLQADPRVRVIMASTLTTRGADIALRALRLGAADYVPKPSTVGIKGNEAFGQELVAKVKGLARLRTGTAGTLPAGGPIKTRPGPKLPPRLLAIGSSTGGPQALFTLFQGLGTGLRVPIVVTQHMPPTFTPILADHISRLGQTPCTEARDGEPLLPGHAYLAPGDRHLIVEGNRASLRGRVTMDPPENFCRPAVDPMLRSAAAACEGRVLIAILTGMGHDGLAGTRSTVDAGGCAIGQDEATSIVWGMPGAIAQAGLCHAVLPLPKIAPRLIELLRGAGS